MARRPQDLDISGANAAFGGNASNTTQGRGRLTPRRPNFSMDLPSPRVGEVPPALSPLDAFALHSRALARKLEESTRAGRRLSRLPHHEIQTELAKRPGYFRALSNESDATSSDHADDAAEDEEEDIRNFIQTSPPENRPVSQYPFFGNAATDRFSRPPSTAIQKPPPPPQLRENDDPGYFGIQVPRSSSPEPFDAQPSKIAAASPALPSLTSSIDSLGSSQPRTLTNESSASKAYQGGLAPPSPLHPRSARSIASIRSVIDSAEEDNGSATGFERVRKSSKNSGVSGMSNPNSPLSPDFMPISRSPSAMSDLSMNEPLPRPSFNFSRPRSSSGTKLTFERPSFDKRPIDRKESYGSSLRETISASQEPSENLSTGETISLRRGPSRKGSGASSVLSRVDTRSTRGPPSRQNSGSAVDTLSVRVPSRQNSSEGSRSVRALSPGPSPGPSPVRSPFQPPSRQGSTSDLRSLRAPSRQNSGTPGEPLAKVDTRSTTRSIRGPPSRQNSGNAVETTSARAPSRQSSATREAPITEAASISEADILSGDESAYSDTRDPHDPRSHNDPRDHRDPRDPRNTGAPSYIYSKYSLPRGRTVERGSAEQRNSWVNHQFKWEEAGPGGPAAKAAHDTLLSPNSEVSPPSLPTTPVSNEFSPSVGRSRSAEPAGAAPRDTNLPAPSTPSTKSVSTDKTIRGRSHVRNSPSQDIAGLSAEEHLERGIHAHNTGSLSKSTYHLRLASRAGLPTAMLLYALACRHGWGMRPNQAEGVQWLKRAVDSSSLEFMADNDPLSVVAQPGQKAAPMTAEQKTRKAQYALAIYELGMSYMNGWGIPRDRSLALRCFEIAGSWGDNDALAEAGFCYTQGVGCKKDLKKAAGFYRRAAEGGMSMAGNSWYVILPSLPFSSSFAGIV